MKKPTSLPLPLLLGSLTLLLGSCRVNRIDGSSESLPSTSMPTSSSSGEEQSTRWAKILFGSEAHTSVVPIRADAIQASGIRVTSIDGSRKCTGESGQALKMGSASEAGSLQIELSSSLYWSSVRILAFPYEGEEPCKLTFNLRGEDYSLSSRCANSEAAKEALDHHEDLSCWSDVTGLFGNANSFSLTSQTRVYVAGIAIEFIGGTKEDSIVSSESSNSGSTSSEDTIPEEPYTPSEHRDEWETWMNGSYTNYIDFSASTTFRLSAVESEDGLTVTCYFYSEERKRFVIGETLRKDGVYTNSSEVALYYNAFHDMPKNYGYYTKKNTNAVMKELYPLYGDSSRLYTDYSRTNGYATVQPPLNMPSGFKYYELDLAYESNNGYASAEKVNRSRAGRIVIFPFGTKNYGDDPYIVKTLDHYAHFREFANYLDGWSANYDGASSDLGDGKVLGDYSKVGPLETKTVR